MELIEFGRLESEERAELIGGEVDPWEMDGSRMFFRPKEWHTAVRDRDGKLIAAAGTMAAEAEVGGRRFPVVGLGGVIVEQPDGAVVMPLVTMWRGLRAGVAWPEGAVTLCGRPF